MLEYPPHICQKRPEVLRETNLPKLASRILSNLHCFTRGLYEALTLQGERHLYTRAALAYYKATEAALDSLIFKGASQIVLN